MANDEKRPPRIGDADIINRAYLETLLIELRYLDSIEPSTAIELYGEKFATPVMTAALSHLKTWCPGGGMVDLARGAKAAGAVLWAGMCEDDELTEITDTGARTIVIIKPFADNDLIMKRIEHARRCGVLAIGMDIDHAYDNSGKFGQVSGFAMASKSVADINEFVKAAGVPFILKGVLSLQDTQKAIEAGAQGIVVSHHHGIQGYAIPPLMILPRIVEMIKGCMPIFVDCGMNTGSDVFKALALGATAVSVGRELMGPLSKEGPDGVQKTIEKITSDLAAAMARTGSPDPAHIDPSVIWRL